jgi:hypothetical protein
MFDWASRTSKTAQKLCHNCDTKPVFTAKTDFIDGLRLLILRNLLKTRIGLKIPAYKLIRHLFNNLRAVLLKLCHNSNIGIRFIFAFAAFNGCLLV